MDDATSRIQAQMEATRAELTSKLEQLEKRVSDSAHQARNQLGETVGQATAAVNNAAKRVQGAAATVIDVFNLATPMRRHPVTTIAGAVALGCLAGGLGRSALMPRRLIATLERSRALQFQIRQLTGLAVGAAMGTLRDLATDVVPTAWVNPVQSTINSWTLRMGGQLIHGRVLRQKVRRPGEPS